MVGVEQARRVLTRFGFYWGHADAAAMKREFQWESDEELLRAGPRLHTLQGVTKSVVRSLTLDADGSCVMELVWYRSGEAEEHVEEFGPSDHPVCWMLCGYASGYASFCLANDVYFMETACRAKGDEVCRAVGRDRASWGQDIEAHLPYFETDDIHGKILELTDELKKKTRELERNRRRLSELEDLVRPDFAEVRSKSFHEVLDLASRVARFDSSVLITGESGVGKEVLARYIHDSSHRAKGEFVAVNCGALPESLLESELFGHRSGSFTGAVRDRKGLFEQANQGTIFLDEISEISPAMQVKLLRVLQEREIRRLGENTQRPIDVRVMAASNQDLEKAVNEGTFRDDLFYRLRVVEIRIPPLRERHEDILPLARFLVKRLEKKLDLPGIVLDAACLEHLQRYPWPGNVRELENALERAAVLSDGGRIKPEGLPAGVWESDSEGLQAPYPPSLSLKEVEKAHIRAVLSHTQGNRSEAAKTLGIGVTTLWRRLKEMETGTGD